MTVTVGQCVGDRRDKEVSVGAAQPVAEHHKYNLNTAQIQYQNCINTLFTLQKYNLNTAKIQSLHCTTTTSTLHRCELNTAQIYVLNALHYTNAFLFHWQVFYYCTNTIPFGIADDDCANS